MHPSPQHYAQAQQQLSSLSLEAQVGQLLTVFFQGSRITPALIDRIQKMQVGGLILYADNTPDAHSVAQLVNQAQALSRIPMWIGIDQEGGNVVRLTSGVTSFPAQMAVAAAGSLDLAQQMSHALGTELKQLGINLTFAPVLDVNSNPANPVIGTRSFGRDPETVAQWGLATIRGYEQAGILCCGKHYPGHGDTSVDSHVGLPVVAHPLDRLLAVEEYPFRQAIVAGIPSLMTAHLLVPAWDPHTPATLSRRILTQRLRQELGFSGLIITDSLSMGALQGSLAETAIAAFLAGADMLLLGADVGHTPAEQLPVYEALLRAVEGGIISPQRLQESVLRLLAYKTAYSIGTPQNPPITVSTLPHQTLAQTITQQSLTLIPAHSPLWQTPVACYYPIDCYDLGSLLRPILPEILLYPYHRQDSPPPAPPPQGVIWIAIHNLNRFPQPRQLLESLPPERTLVINTGSPYDLADSSYHRLITYGHQPHCLKAILTLLQQQQRPQGEIVF